MFACTYMFYKGGHYFAHIGINNGQKYLICISCSYFNVTSPGH